MRDFILFTAEKLTKENCFDKLHEAMNNLADNGEKGIVLEGKHRLYVWFSDERIYEPADSSSDYFQGRVPIENAYITYVETYRSIDLKRIIEVLVEDHPELFVYCDDMDWTGSGAKFLKTDFEF